MSQVCCSWKTFANQLRYQEIELGLFHFSFPDLLTKHQRHSSIFYETRRLNVTTTWFNNTRDLPSFVQSMPRLEWLQLSTHIIEESYCSTWLPSILGPHQSSLLYLDLESLHYKDTIFIDSECISLISSIAIRLRRLTCAIRYITAAAVIARTSNDDGDDDGGGGQVQVQMLQAAPRFEDLQVLRLLDIRCGPGCEQVAREWFSRWHLPSLKQFYIPRNWEYCMQLLDRGVGAQIEVLDASVCGVLFFFKWFAGMNDIIHNHRQTQQLYLSNYGFSAIRVSFPIGSPCPWRPQRQDQDQGYITYSSIPSADGLPPSISPSSLHSLRPYHHSGKNKEKIQIEMESTHCTPSASGIRSCLGKPGLNRVVLMSVSCPECDLP